MFSFTLRKWINALSEKSRGRGPFRIWLKGWQKDEYLQVPAYRIVGRTIVLGDLDDLSPVSRKVIDIDDVAMIEDGVVPTVDADIKAMPTSIADVIKSVPPGRVIQLTDGILKTEMRSSDR